MFGKSSQTCAECAEFVRSTWGALLLSPLRHAPHRTSAPPGSHLHTSNEQGPLAKLSDSILDLSDRPGRLCGHVVVHNLDRPAAAVK